MSKRFTDSDKFKDIWYRKLTPKQKCIWEFLLSECNHAGIIELDLEFASFVIGETVTNEDLIPFENKIRHLEKEIYFIPNFIEFQYGTLNAQSKVHASVLKELEKYNIDTLCKWLDKGIETLKDKDKDKDKEKDISIKLYGEYSNVNLSSEQYGKLLAMCASQKLLNELINSFSIAIEVGKERPYNAALPNAHYERIKSFYNYRKKNPDKFITYTRPELKPYKPEKLDLSPEEQKEADETGKRVLENFRKNFYKIGDLK